MADVPTPGHAVRSSAEAEQGSGDRRTTGSLRVVPPREVSGETEQQPSHECYIGRSVRKPGLVAVPWGPLATSGRAAEAYQHPVEVVGQTCGVCSAPSYTAVESGVQDSRLDVRRSRMGRLSDCLRALEDEDGSQ